MARITFVALFVLCLLSLPIQASQPSGLAGKMISNPSFRLDHCSAISFDMYEFFYDQTLDPSDTLTLEFAIIPFRSGVTLVSLQDSMGSEFLNLQFSGGKVQGLDYRRTRWNDISVVMHPATQDYLLTVNGLQSGPFPYPSFCAAQGGCFTVSALRILADVSVESSGWLDSLSVSTQNTGFYEETFDDTCKQPDVFFGGLLIEPAP
jgi:hypothetical protein